MDKIIEKKELEQKMLESELTNTKEENLQNQQKALTVREDVLSNFADLLEMELQCSICSELFVQVRVTEFLYYGYCDLLFYSMKCSLFEF